jgi:hypothetical protein
MPFKALVDVALKDMKLDIHCMGTRDGRPGVYTAFSNGGQELRLRGCIDREGRSWFLTDAGREVAKSGKIPPRLKTPPPKPAPKPPVRSNGGGNPLLSVVKAGGGIAVLAPVRAKESSTPAPEWMTDPYLRTLVAGNTPCFGTYEVGNKTCVPCPLRAHCGGALSASLSQLAGAIALDAERKPQVSAGAVKKAAELVVDALTSETPRAAPKPEHREMVANHDSICARTGLPIKRGDRTYYVPGEGVVSAAAYEKGK